jgi:hypothetical protein
MRYNFHIGFGAGLRSGESSGDGVVVCDLELSGKMTIERHPLFSDASVMNKPSVLKGPGSKPVTAPLRGPTRGNTTSANAGKRTISPADTSSNGPTT